MTQIGKKNQFHFMNAAFRKNGDYDLLGKNPADSKLGIWCYSEYFLRSRDVFTNNSETNGEF